MSKSKTTRDTQISMQGHSSRTSMNMVGDPSVSSSTADPMLNPGVSSSTRDGKETQACHIYKEVKDEPGTTWKEETLTHYQYDALSDSQVKAEHSEIGESGEANVAGEDTFAKPYGCPFGTGSRRVSISEDENCSTTDNRTPEEAMPPPPDGHDHLLLARSQAAKRDKKREDHVTSSIPDLEFDGNTVLCRVCGDKASGFHYGVHSCEGCKGFFRRSIQQKIQYRPCTKNQQCTIQRVNRNRCQYCRLKKCIAVGMSRDAVRFGRVPKREKARIMAAMQSKNARSVEKTIMAELDDDVRVITSIIQLYMDTCEYTKDKVSQMLDHARTLQVYTHFSQYSTCPLNPSDPDASGGNPPRDFSERFSIAIRGVIDFSRRLPGFQHLPREDQVILLTESALEALLVRLTALFNSQNNTLLCMNGRLMKREAVYGTPNSRFLMDSMFNFSDRLNRLRLSDEELALFSAVVVITPERPGLRSKDLIERMHSRYVSYLQNLLARNHPDMPDLHQTLLSYILDLKTLNTLHSEKLICQKRIDPIPPSGHWEDSHTTWHEKDLGSPSSSCAADEAMRSPISCSESMCGETGSSEGSVCGSEVSTYLELRPQHRRRRDHSEGTSSGDEASDASLKCPFTKRKVDSSDDSGIESDKISLPSICSSPRSSIDEKSEEDREEDMPVLRRALEAPPIVNTDLYMEAAYKPHKKFRALRKEDEPHSSQPGYSCSGSSILAHSLSQSNQMSPRSSSSPSSSSLLASALTAPSFLAKTLSEQPKMSEDSLRKADMLHSLIVQNETMCQRTRQDNSRVPPAPYYIPHSVSERLQPPSSNWSSSGNDSPTTSHSRPHLLTTPTPSRYYSSSTPVGLGAQPPNSPLRNSPNPHGMGAQSRRSISPVMKLQVDIADSPEPLNLSKKTPPPTPEFMMEA